MASSWHAWCSIKIALLNVGIIALSLLCRAFICILIRYIFYQEESDDGAVKEQVNNAMNVGRNEIKSER
jgi:hypothetical protein